MKSLLKRPIIEVKDSLGNNHRMFESLFGDERACFAKGMGLILGVRTRKARFNIFCKPTPKLNLVIEISGPNKTMCSEKISVFNPRKRVSADVVTTSVIADYLNRNKFSEDFLKIPLFYEVFPNRIVVTYIPLMKGIHKLSIIWQGQHIMNSPYTVKVEDCSHDSMRDNEQSTGITSPTKFIPGLQWPVNALSRSDSFCLENCGTVVRRKVLKQSIVLNGRQQTFEDIESGCDKNSEELKSGKHFEDNDYNSKVYDKILISESPSNSPKPENFSINGFNRNTNLFVIKECDSLGSEKSGFNDPKEEPNYQNIGYLDTTQETDDKPIEAFNDLSDTIDKGANNTNETNISKAHHIVSRQSSYKNQNIVNNINYRSYIPVKNMIQSWEMKLSKNINEINEKEAKKMKADNTLPKSQIPCILVNNRKEVFEKNISTVPKSDIKGNNSMINCLSNCENQISSEIMVNQNERNGSLFLLLSFTQIM